MEKKNKIALKYFEDTVKEEVCTDWYDVADWLKERATNNKITIVLGWRYLREK